MDERLRFVARLLDGEKMAGLCDEFGTSHKTGYKIYERYRRIGVQGLTDRSRRPYRKGGHAVSAIYACCDWCGLEWNVHEHEMCPGCIGQAAWREHHHRRELREWAAVVKRREEQERRQATKDVAVDQWVADWLMCRLENAGRRIAAQARNFR